MTDIKKTPIPQRLKNVSNDHPYVAGAIDIIDDATGENQQAINGNTYRKNEVYSKEETNNVISRTPETDVVILDVPEGSTALDVLDEVPVADRPNKLFRVINDDNTAFSEYGWTGSEWAVLANKDYGIDNKPQRNSSNMAKSGGIYESVIAPMNAANKYHAYNDEVIEGKYINDNGIFANDSTRGVVFTKVLEGSSVVSSYLAGSYSFYSGYPDTATGSNFIEKNFDGTVPSGAEYVGIIYRLQRIQNVDIYITQDGSYVTDLDLADFKNRALAPVYDELYDKKAISEEKTNLSSALSPYTEGYGVLATNGGLYTSSVYNASDFVDIHSYQKITYLRGTATMLGSQGGMAFYDEKHRFLSGQKFVYSNEYEPYIETTLDVPEGAYYVRVSAYVDTETWGDMELYGISVEYERTSKIDYMQKDLYNFKRVLNGESEDVIDFRFYNGRIKYQDGVKDYSETTAYSTYIDVSRFAKIFYKRIGVTTASSVAGMAFYDADKVYISGQQVMLNQPERNYMLTELDVPANAVYARFTWWRASVGLGDFGIMGYLFDIEKESKTDILQDEVDFLQEEIDAISGGGEGVDSNLKLNQMDIVEGNIIISNGTHSSNSSMGCTDYIPCHGAETISYNKVVGNVDAGMAFYDSEKNYITGSFIPGVSGQSGMQRTTVRVPEGAYYFRASGWNYTNSLQYGDFYASLSSSDVCINGHRASNNESTFFSVLYNSAIDDLSVEDFTEQSQEKTMVCTTAVVLLPPSYTMKGKPSRVIVNFHGWSHYVNYKQWGAAGSDYAGFMKQKERWANAGYVVVDVNHKNSSQKGSYSGLGSVQDDECYRKALEWVYNNYNVEKTCFIVCGSAGGPNGINACYNWPDVRAAVWLDCWIDVSQHPYPSGCGNYYYGYSGSYDAEKVGARNPIRRILSTEEHDYLLMPKIPVKLYHLTSGDEFMEPFVDIIEDGKAYGDYKIRHCSGITHSVLVSGGDGTDPKAEIVDAEIINFLDQY